MDKKCIIDKIENLKKVGETFVIEGGYLCTIPFNYKDVMPECVGLLSRWRIENPSLSPQRFPVSDERTETWLQRSILNNETRVMFMIRNRDGTNIGHIGLSEIDFEKAMIRIDSIMRGVKNDSPGIIGNSIEFLKEWCKSNFQAECVDLIVLDDNDKAINLYKRCGFVYLKTIPLRKVEKDGEIIWVEDYTIKKPKKKYINMICKLGKQELLNTNTYQT